MNCEMSVIKQDSPNSVIIDTSSESLSESHKCMNSNYKTPELDSLSNEEGPFNNGRWTPFEHLIFMACIIQFGRDWKKIEFYVQTRSSSQARSHAQKVLKKLDRPAMIRDVLRQKEKLGFDPVEHKWQSLNVFGGPEELAALEAMCGKKRKAKTPMVNKFMKISDIGKR